MSDILRTLRGQRTDPPPIWLMRQAGRYLPEYRELRTRAENFLDFCYTPELAVEATLQPLRRYDLSAAIIFSDILVIPHALGQKVAFTEGEGPQLPPLSPEDLSRLHPLHTEMLQPVYTAITETRRAMPAHVALLGFAGAPWTLAVYMLGGGAPHDFPALIKLAESQPQFMDSLMAILCDAVVSHLRNQADAGADAVQIFDSWAGALSAHTDHYRRLVIDPHRRILSSLRDSHPTLPIIAFPRGSDTAYEDFCMSLHDLLTPGAISIDQNTSLEFAARVLQPHVTVQGNLSPELLLGDDFAPCEAAARHICRMLGKGAHIFNLGHGVDKHTPPDNVARLIEVVRGGVTP